MKKGVFNFLTLAKGDDQVEKSLHFVIDNPGRLL